MDQLPKKKQVRWLRAVLALEIVGVVYIATFFALNLPAYVKKAHFAVRGQDLSAALDGSYVPLDALPVLPEEPARAFGVPPEYPEIEVELTAPASSGISTTNAATIQEPPDTAPPISPINPNQFVANTVTIPRIGVRAPLVEISRNTEREQQRGLSIGVIHLAETPRAGQPGNAFFAGHSSDFLFKTGNYKTVFALLPEIKKGDYFILSDKDHAYYYTIVETIITGPYDTSVLKRGGPAEAFASLQTSYPVGTAQKRFVAVGKLSRTVASK